MHDRLKDIQGKLEHFSRNLLVFKGLFWPQKTDNKIQDLRCSLHAPKHLAIQMH